MKKLILLMANLLLISQLSTAQSVTLATTIANPTNGTVYYNNATNLLQYWNGTAWIPITNNAAGTGWGASGNDIYNANTGKVGIGTSTPKATFNVAAGKTVLFGADSSGYGNRLIWYPSKAAFRVGHPFGNMWDYDNIGDYSIAMGFGASATAASSTAMGNNTTANGYISTTMGYGTIANGNYSTAMGVGTIANGYCSTTMGYGIIASENYSTAMGKYNVDVANALLMLGKGTGLNTPSNALTIMNDGRTGINTTNPLATLHVQGSTYLSDNVGIGTSFPLGKLQVNGDSYFLGNIGIGTTAPIASLHVAGSQAYTSANSHYFSYASSNFSSSANFGGYVGILADWDIVTKNTFISAQSVTNSDARIKNIINLSNSKQDLELLKQIKITDYRYKDVVTWGNQTFKKVIAQQVEEVYPQAVRKMTSTIPDIYSLAEKVVFDETNKTLKCSLSKCYDIKIGEKIEFVHEKEGKIKAEVVEVSGNSFTVKDWQYPTDKIFVYGREVNDFRSVDYEAISMLGISAIQQLAKENEALKSKFTTENDVLKKQIADLYARFERFEAMVIKETKTIEKLNN